MSLLLQKLGRYLTVPDAGSNHCLDWRLFASLHGFWLSSAVALQTWKSVGLNLYNFCLASVCRSVFIDPILSGGLKKVKMVLTAM